MMATVIFIAGTDTDVGKTYVAALIAQSLHHSGVNVGVYKPVASDCEKQNGILISDDAMRLWQAAGKPASLDDVCPQKFIAPLAPNVAAAAEGTSVDPQQLVAGAKTWQERCEFLIVEGAGGLLSPLADGVLNIDLFKQLQPAQLLIVAANRLGAIHQTLATCAAAEKYGATPSGIILCSPSPSFEGTSNRLASDSSVASNASQIATYTDVPLLGQVGFGDKRLPFDPIALMARR